MWRRCSRSPFDLCPGTNPQCEDNAVTHTGAWPEVNCVDTPWHPCGMVPAMTTTAALGDGTLFPDLQAQSYLSWAAIAVPSTAVRERVGALLDDYGAHGVGALHRHLAQRDATKALLARLLGTQPANLGFVQSTTPGLLWLAFGLPWKRGDRVVLFEGEFPANVTPWRQAAAMFGLELVFVPVAPFAHDVQAGLAAAAAQLNKGARLVAVSAVQFQTGLRMPVRELGALAHKYGAQLCVDAVQALGAVPLNVAEVDYLACGAHKFLMGLEGAGFVYVAPQHLAAFEPRLAGWLGHQDALQFLFEGPGHLRADRPLRQTADVSEQGAQSGASLVALQASVELIADLGVDAIHGHTQAYHDALEPELVARGFVSARTTYEQGRSASLCLQPPPGVDVRLLQPALAQRGVVASIPDGWLRLAPHWPNSLQEISGVLNAMDAALRSL